MKPIDWKNCFFLLLTLYSVAAYDDDSDEFKPALSSDDQRIFKATVVVRIDR